MTAAVERQQLTQRVLEMRNVMKKLLGAGVYKELRGELQSVTIHQLSTLSHLKGGSLTMRELAKALDVTESSVTAVTDRLVRQGLVARHGDPADRRIVRLELSEDGAALVKRLDEATATNTAELLAVLSDAQLAQLVEILQTLASAAEDVTAPVGQSPHQTPSEPDDQNEKEASK